MNTLMIAAALVSSFGYDPVNATRFIQKAIDSGEKTIVLDAKHGVWNTDPLWVVGKDDLTIIIEKDAVLSATRGRYMDIKDALLTIRNSKNITIKGGGMIRMYAEDYNKPPYEKAEWRHAINAHGNVKNLVVEDLTLRDSGGDGVYVNDVEGCVIRNVVSDGNLRQAISVISAKDLLIENCSLVGTKGAPPQAAIDFEPNSASEHLVNCLVRNCVLSRNEGCGIEFALFHFNGKTEPVSITVENCVITANRRPPFTLVSFCSPANAARGFIKMANCTIERPYGVEDIRVDQNDDLPIKILMENVKCRDYAADGTYTERTLNQQWIADMFPHAKAEPAVYPPSVAIDFAKYTPVDKKPGETVATTPLRIRHTGFLVFYADKAGTVEFEVQRARLGKYAVVMKSDPIKIYDAEGREIQRIPTETIKLEPSVMAVKVPAAGFYTIKMNINPIFQFLKTPVPLAIDLSRDRINLNALPGKVWLSVPEGNGKFAFFAGGDFGEERVHVKLNNPEGTKVFDMDNLGRWHAYVSGEAPMAGLWQAEFARPSKKGTALDDYKCEVTGVMPFLFLSPEKYWK